MPEFQVTPSNKEDNLLGKYAAKVIESEYKRIFLQQNNDPLKRRMRAVIMSNLIFGRPDLDFIDKKEAELLKKYIELKNES